MPKGTGTVIKSQAKAMAPTARAGDKLPKEPRARTPRGMADALENDVSGMGTPRDKRYYSRYSTVIRMSDYQIRSMFRSSWVAKRIVKTPVEDMLRKWFTLSWDGVDKSALSIIRREEQRLAVREKFTKGMTWGRAFGGALGVVFIKGQTLDQPLVMKSIAKDSLQFLHVDDRTWTYPTGVVDRDELSPNFGMPLYYTRRNSSIQVHHSRVIRFEGEIVPTDDFLVNNFWHDSVLQAVEQAVKDFDSATGNVSSMLFEACIDVIMTDLAKQLAKKDGLKTVTERYALAALGKSNYGALLLDAAEKYERKQIAFTGVVDVVRQLVTHVAGAAGMPVTKLFGEGAKGLSATGEHDQDNYYDRIDSDRETHLRPPAMRFYEILVRSALGRMPDDFEITFPPLTEVSEKDRALIQYQQAQARQIYWNMGAIHEGLVARELEAEGAFKTMTEDDVDLAEELATKIEPEPEPGQKKGAENPDDLPPEDDAHKPKGNGLA